MINKTSLYISSILGLFILLGLSNFSFGEENCTNFAGKKMMSCVNEKINSGQNEVIDEFNKTIKGYSSKEEFKNTQEKVKSNLKETFNNLSRTWNKSLEQFKGSENDVAKQAFNAVENLNPGLVRKTKKGNKIINLKGNNDETSSIVRGLLVTPFKNSTGEVKSNVYNPNKDISNDRKVFKRPERGMAMGVIEKENVDMQERALTFMCRSMVCIKNSNGDLLVYPNLPKRKIEAFSYFQCTWDDENEKFDCNDKNDPPIGVNPPQPPVEPPGPPNGDEPCINGNCGTTGGIVIPPPSNNPDDPVCGNGDWEYEKGEECEQGVAQWDNNNCSSECEIISDGDDNDKLVTPPPYNEKAYCGKGEGDIFNGKKIKSVSLSLTNFSIDNSPTSYDNYIYTGYINYELEDGSIEEQSVKYTGKMKYYKVGDYNGDGKLDKDLYFGSTNNKAIGEDDLNNFNISDIAKLPVIQDNTKQTKYKNMKNLIMNKFNGYNNGSISSSYIDKKFIKREIIQLGNVDGYTKNGSDCTVNTNLRRLNLYKINGTIQNKAGVNMNSDLTLPNVYAIDRLYLKDNTLNNMNFPYLHHIHQAFHVNNLTINENLNMPFLKQIGNEVNYMTYSVDSNTLNAKKDIYGTFFKESDINNWNTDLVQFFKNLSFSKTQLDNFSNNGQDLDIYPVIKNGVEYNYEANSINLSHQWIGTLGINNNSILSDDITSKFKYIGNFYSKNQNNWTGNFNRLTTIRDGFYLRYSDGNTYYMPQLKRLNTINLNNDSQKECSQKYINNFRATNTVTWDVYDSSKNDFHIGSLRYIGFAEERKQGPLFDFIKKFFCAGCDNIGITAKWNGQSIDNRVFLNIKNVCGGNNELEKGIYTYHDGTSWHDKGAKGYFKPGIQTINDMQGYMLNKTNIPPDVETSIDLNKQHLEFITNASPDEWNDGNTLRNALWDGKSKEMDNNVSDGPPWLGEVGEDGVQITLGSPSTTDDSFDYNVTTPDYSYAGSGGPTTTTNEYCRDGKDLVRERKRDGEIVRTKVVGECTYSVDYCKNGTGHLSQTIEEGVDEAVDYFYDNGSYIETKVFTGGCLKTTSTCKNGDRVVKEYKYEGNGDLYDTTIRAGACAEPTTTTTKTVEPTKPVEVFTVGGATDLIINENSPIIHTNDGKVYGLSNTYWLSYINTDSNVKEAETAFAFKDFFYYEDDDSSGDLSSGDTAFIKTGSNSNDRINIGPYSGDIANSGEEGIAQKNSDGSYTVYSVEDSSKPESGTGGVGDIWTLGYAYTALCEVDADMCHYNHNDYQYFELGGTDYIIGTFISPDTTVEIDDSDGNTQTIPQDRVYKLFKKQSNSKYWKDKGNILTGDNITLEGVTVNSPNDSVNLFYDNDGNDKSVLLQF